MNPAALTLDAPDEPLLTPRANGGKTRARCRLALMIFLSLLAHAATFYVFQVAYTPAGSLLPPPARVVLVPLDRPENASFARWLSLTDPTLATQPQFPVTGMTDDVAGLRYVPSYEARPPDFKPLDLVAPAEGITAPPQPFVPGPVPVRDSPAPKTAPAPDAPRPTRIVLSGSLQALVSTPLPPIQPGDATGMKTAEPTVFLVGVRMDGEEPFLFPVRQAPASTAGANADEADEIARSYLARLPLRRAAAPEDGRVIWGRATFYWGDDTRPKKSP